MTWFYASIHWRTEHYGTLDDFLRSHTMIFKKMYHFSCFSLWGVKGIWTDLSFGAFPCKIFWVCKDIRHCKFIWGVISFCRSSDSLADKFRNQHNPKAQTKYGCMMKIVALFVLVAFPEGSMLSPPPKGAWTEGSGPTGYGLRLNPRKKCGHNVELSNRKLFLAKNWKKPWEKCKRKHKKKPEKCKFCEKTRKM